MADVGVIPDVYNEIQRTLRGLSSTTRYDGIGSFQAHVKLSVCTIDQELTSHAQGELSGSWRTLLHVQQRAAGVLKCGS